MPGSVHDAEEISGIDAGLLQKRQPLSDVAQLPDVAGPVVTLERFYACSC
jgi:hypothetical protein